MTTNHTRTWAAIGWMLLAISLSAPARAAQAPPSSPPAPGNVPPAAPPKPAETLIEFHDELGRLVRVPAAPQRIVSLAPNLTETVFALESGDRLVGVTDFCDYPPEALTRARVGGPINPNFEQIVSLHPDVVLATRALNRRETVEALDRLGFPVFTTDPRTVEDVIASTRRLGKLLGVEARGESLATELEQRLAELARRLAGRPARRVFFVVWTDPIISTGPHTFLADALRRAGAESVVSVEQDWPQIGIEELLRQNPDFLVFSGTHPDDPQSTISSLEKRPGWSSLDAVRERHYAVVSDALARPAPRLLDAIEDLARQLHPDAFPAAPEQKPRDPAKRLGGRL
ncbi:MAG TPA: cobalamin-binding protein [Candidatus Acidoferrales bacterium]|nr:cobalamin-binding protein [Candidatus Acidoferrales bacterium]